MSAVLTKRALMRLKTIHQMSKQCNGLSKTKHLRKLLSLAQKHIDEILLLKQYHNPHYLVETGDLLILCFEILLENNKNLDHMMEQCFSRYEHKLNQLMSGIL